MTIFENYKNAAEDPDLPDEIHQILYKAALYKAKTAYHIKKQYVKNQENRFRLYVSRPVEEFEEFDTDPLRPKLALPLINENYTMSVRKSHVKLKKYVMSIVIDSK